MTDPTAYSAAKPWLDDGDLRLYHGDVLEVLRSLPAGIAQTCVTSPPYWGLRSYLDAGHDDKHHELGLEETPDAYVAKMVEVFREVRRVLRDDGTLWLNIGDSYSGSAASGGSGSSTLNEPESSFVTRSKELPNGLKSGLKPKDLVGIPWRVAFALQADGWYLRSDIIWSKLNPMPESVTDRPTKAHEYVFLLAKGQWKSRVVQFADLSGEPLHLGANLGPKSPDLVARDFCVRIATAILDRTKVEQQSGLPTFDPEVWQHRVTGLSRSAVGHLPVEHWAAVLSTRLLGSDVSPKDFMCELQRRGVALADRDELLVADGLPLVALPPGVSRYGKTAVAIHDSGEIGEIDFEAHTVKHSRPSGCSYFYDADAVREPHQERRPGIPTVNGYSEGSGRFDSSPHLGNYGYGAHEAGRNLRSVWQIATQPFPEAHFATYPEELVRRCILAGTSEKGECGECGAPWRRIVEREHFGKEPSATKFDKTMQGGPLSGSRQAYRANGMEGPPAPKTTGWEPSCSCHQDSDPVNQPSGLPNAGIRSPAIPQLVLDPFIGSGTTALVARKHGRRSIGIDLSADYLAIAAKRTQQLSLLGGAA